MWARMRPSDAQVVRSVLAGSSDEFGVLVERYQGVAYAVAFGCSGIREDAQDIAQEAFLRAYRSLHTLREPAKFAGWLVQIVRNTANTLLQDRRLEAFARAGAASAEVLAPDPSRAETRELLRLRILEMDPQNRQVLMLHYYVGKSAREIAALLGISRDAVKKRLERARQALSARVLSELEPAVEPPASAETRSNAIMLAVLAVPAPRPAIPSAALVGTSMKGILLKIAAVVAIVGTPLGIIALHSLRSAPTDEVSPALDLAGAPAFAMDVRELLDPQAILDAYARQQDKVRGFSVHYAEEEHYEGKLDHFSLPSGSKTTFTEGWIFQDFEQQRTRFRHKKWGKLSVADKEIPKEKASDMEYRWADGVFLQYLSGPGMNVVARTPEAVERHLKDPLLTMTCYFPGAEGIGYFCGDQRRLDKRLTGAKLTLREGTERVGDELCQVIEAQTKFGHITAWFEPAKDFAVKKYIVELSFNDIERDDLTLAQAFKVDKVTKRVELTVAKFANVGGVWLPVEIDEKEHAFFPNGDYHRSNRTVRLDSWTVNPNFDKARSFAMTGVPDDSLWSGVNEKPGATFRWDGGKLTKIADTFEETSAYIKSHRQNQ